MFGIGLEEFLLTIIVGIILIGPKEIPVVAISIIKFIRKIKSISNEVNKSVEVFMTETELKSIIDNKELEEEFKVEVEDNDKSA